MNVSDQDSLRFAISRVDSDLRDDVIAAVHALSHTPLPSVFPDVGTGDVVSQISSSGNSVGGVGGLQLHGTEYYPESFKVFQEEPGGGYVCRNPIVVTPDGEVGVENSDTLSPGSTWYCVVRKDKDGKWSASMVTEGGVSSARQSGDRVFYSVKIAEIAPGSNGGYVYQYHTGAIVVGDLPVPVDDVSVEDHSDDNEGDLRYAVKGWHDQDASESKLGDLLTGDEEDTSRQILVRNGKGGAIEFLQIGKVEKPSGVDDVSIEDHSDDNDGDLRYAVKGWHDQDASEAKLGDLLTGDVEDTSRQILVRNGKGGAIEFLPIGKVAAANDSEKDPDEENPPPEGDPCAHPGDKDNGGGVSPDDEEPGGGGGAVGGGGVSPGEGGTHPGNDNCNCD